MEFSSIDALVAKMKSQITRSEDMSIKALLRIYEYQTATEKAEGNTHMLNGVGFTGTDGEILSTFVENYKRYGKLTNKQLAILHNKIGKYARQLVMQSIERGLIRKNGKHYVW